MPRVPPPRRRTAGSDRRTRCSRGSATLPSPEMDRIERCSLVYLLSRTGSLAHGRIGKVGFTQLPSPSAYAPLRLCALLRLRKLRVHDLCILRVGRAVLAWLAAALRFVERFRNRVALALQFFRRARY